MIPLFKSALGEEEKAAVIRALMSDTLSRGEEIVRFEDEFAAFVGKKHAVAVSNGTCALHLAVRALGWKKGDEVITTPFSYIASSNCLLYENVTPVFADIDPETFLLDPRTCEKKLTRHTSGILLVHLFGATADAKRFAQIKQKENVRILEDACQAIGVPSSRFPVGSVGDAVAYSFFENKPITTGGEGGMIVTDRDDIAVMCKSLRDQGRSGNPKWIDHVQLGFNYRMTEIQAVIGRVQLKRLPEILRKRHKVSQWYESNLKEIPYLKLPYSASNLDRSWFCYYVQFSSKQLRDRAYTVITRSGFEVKKGYFPPIYRFPMHRKFLKRGQVFPNTEHVYKSILILPIYQDLKREVVDRICSIIRGLRK